MGSPILVYQRHSIRHTYPCTIVCLVVGSKYGEVRSPANCNLLDIRHEIVWNSKRIFTNVATRMCTNRVEVSKQYDLPFRVRAMYIPANLFNKKLLHSNNQIKTLSQINFPWLSLSLPQRWTMVNSVTTLVRPYGLVAEIGDSSVQGTSFGQP